MKENNNGRKLNACLFFPWLPICSSKICPVVTKHILKLPIHMLGPLIYSQMCVGSIHLFREKRWMGLRADNEKRKQTVAFYCLLVFSTLGWINKCLLHTGWVWVTPNLMVLHTKYHQLELFFLSFIHACGDHVQNNV